MGLRTYIGIISNEKYSLIENSKTSKDILEKLKLIPDGEVYDKDIHFLYGGDFCDEYFEIGDFFIPKTRMNGCSKFFKNGFNPFDFLVLINDDIFKKIILEHEIVTQDFHAKLIEPFIDEKGFLKVNLEDKNDMLIDMFDLLNHFYRISVDNGAIDLLGRKKSSRLDFNKDSTHLKHTSFYEYDILNLLNWYKSIDWDNNKVFFIGW